MYRLVIVIALSMMAVIVGCVAMPVTKAPADKITLVYSANLDGELEPCGCSEGGNKGGIKRIVHVTDQLRAKYPDLFLLSAGGLLVSEMPQDKVKSEYILKGFAAMNFDAIGVQWRDLGYGPEFVQTTLLPFVSSNWQNGNFAPSKTINRAGRRVSYFQWLDPKANPAQQMHGEHAATADVTKLAQALAQAKAEGNTTVLASTLTLEEAQSTLPLENVDIVIIKAKYEAFGEPKKIGKTLFLEPGSRGMRLGVLDLSLDPRGGITAFNHEVIALPPEVGDAPRMNAWYEEYNARVKTDYEKRVALRAQMKVAVSPYAGANSCKSCHAKEYEIWRDTPHAGAFHKLQDVNKAFDPDCIGCHTVGFEKPGGFLDEMLTPELMHVQCENCHGAARQHVESAGKIKVANASWKPKEFCAQCHVQKHSPDFVFEKYWPKIAHGKVG